MGQLFALLFGATCGLGNIFASRAMENSDDDRFTGQFIILLINNVINFLVLIIYLILGNRFNINIPGIMFFCISGFFISFLGRAAFFSSIPYIGVSRSSIFKITSPMFGIAGGVIILGEVMSFRALASTILVIAGIIYITLETTKGNNEDDASVLNVASSFIYMPKKGILLGLLSGFFMGIGNVFRKIGINYIPSSILGTCIGTFVGLITVTIFQIANGRKRELMEAVKNLNIDFILSGIFSSIAMFSTFISLKYIPVSYSNSISASESLFTMMWSLIICGKKELLTIRTLIGALLVITGIILLLIFK